MACNHSEWNCVYSRNQLSHEKCWGCSAILSTPLMWDGPYALNNFWSLLLFSMYHFPWMFMTRRPFGLWHMWQSIFKSKSKFAKLAPHFGISFSAHSEHENVHSNNRLPEMPRDTLQMPIHGFCSSGVGTIPCNRLTTSSGSGGCEH